MKYNFNHVFNWFGGRSSFFALFFFAFGVVLAFVSKLSSQYIALAGAIQALVAVRSVADDYHTRNSNGNGNGNGHSNGGESK